MSSALGQSVNTIDRIDMVARMFAWASLTLLAAFLINNYLTVWQGWPGPLAFNDSPLAVLQFGLYLAAIAIAVVYVMVRPRTVLRVDSQTISGINTFIIRAAFWSVLFIGLVDTGISFLRVEQLLDATVGEDLARELGRSQFRGPYIHMPLMLLGLLLAMVTRTLGFTWLALLVVLAELLIVITRFVFSYEQALMADLVRFWYAALFLFASAYTLLEEGHVRVDVFYAGFGARTKGFVNGFGAIVLGLAFCWTILLVGMGDKTSIINAPILSFETTQSGVGLYVKYLMAAFLGLFAVSMAIQFTSYFLDALADYRGDPGGRDHDVHAVQ